MLTIADDFDRGVGVETVGVDKTVARFELQLAAETLLFELTGLLDTLWQSGLSSDISDK